MKIIRHLKFWKKMNQKKNRTKKGISLLEASLAIAIAATISVSVLSLVSSAFEMQSRSEKIFLAFTLAQAKMNQILSNPVLSPTQQKGTIDASIYQGFEYEIIIKEEEMDLAKISQTGTLGSSIDDLLPASVQNFKSREKKGQNLTETGGMIPVYKIKLIIFYPIKGNQKGKYEILSYKAIKNIQ